MTVSLLLVLERFVRHIVELFDQTMSVCIQLLDFLLQTPHLCLVLNQVYLELFPLINNLSMLS